MNPTDYRDLNTSPRILLGPGPNLVPPRVLRAMAQPLVGHLDPEFLKVMTDVRNSCATSSRRRTHSRFRSRGWAARGWKPRSATSSRRATPCSSASTGILASALVEMAGRYGARVDRLDRSWGEVFVPNEVEDALRGKGYKLAAFVHAETSTGALQPHVAEIAASAHRHGALLVLDTVTSLGGVPLEIDEWDVDVAYSGSQKCLSCPPGLAPITIGARAREVLRSRKTKVANWYLDMTLVGKVLGRRAHLSPHGAHHHGLCVARSAPHRGRRRTGDPVCPASRQRGPAVGRTGGVGPAAVRAARTFKTGRVRTDRPSRLTIRQVAY